MAKSKKCVHIVNPIFLSEGLHQTSHTNHNQNKKAHRNGIKKPKSAGRTRSLKGVRFTPQLTRWMMLDTLFPFQVDPKVLLPYWFRVLIRVTYPISQFRRNALYALVGSVSSI